MSHRIAAASLLAVSLIQVAPARAYDIDCAIMLCMAGGFPASPVCSAAHAEMMRRITPWPVEPPFGICTFLDLPVSLGGSGGERTLDISPPDFDWLRRTRVLWWRGQTFSSREHGQLWSWSVQSCDHENTNCHVLARVSRSETPWPDSFRSESGQTIRMTDRDGRRIGNGRAVLVEYGDFSGQMDHSDWVKY